MSQKCNAIKPPVSMPPIPQRVFLFARQHIGSALRFMVLTLFSMIVNFGGTFFLHEVLCLDARLSFALVLVAAYVMNFLLARSWVFASSQTAVGKQLVLFLITSLCFRIGEYLVFTFLYTVLDVWYLLAVFISLCSFYAIKFLVYRFVVFKPQREVAHG